MTNLRIGCLLAAVWLSAGCGSDSGETAAPYECTATAADCLSELAGQYEGTYSGDTQGTWEATITPSGALSGTAHNSVADSDESLVGSMSDTGRMVFGTSSDGAAFAGQVSAQYRISGTWNLDGHSGTFEGRRVSTTETGTSSTAETSGCLAMLDDVSYCRELAANSLCTAVADPTSVAEPAAPMQLAAGCPADPVATCEDADGTTVLFYATPTETATQALCAEPSAGSSDCVDLCTVGASYTCTSASATDGSLISLPLEILEATSGGCAALYGEEGGITTRPDIDCDTGTICWNGPGVQCETAAFTSSGFVVGDVSCQATSTSSLVDLDVSSDTSTTADDSCQTCQTTSCSTEIAATTEAGLLGYSDCISACASLECLDECAVNYPEAGAAIACMQANCAAECG
jgi:hypothetical protein